MFFCLHCFSSPKDCDIWQTIAPRSTQGFFLSPCLIRRLDWLYKSSLLDWNVHNKRLLFGIWIRPKFLASCELRKIFAKVNFYLAPVSVAVYTPYTATDEGLCLRGDIAAADFVAKLWTPKTSLCRNTHCAPSRTFINHPCLNKFRCRTFNFS